MPRASKGFIFIFILLYLNVSGQNANAPTEWKKIDSAIRTRKNLEDIKVQILGLKATAIAEHNDAALARCFVDLLLIEDQKTEDSLFFRNAAFMDSILTTSSSSALLKSIMHLLLARRITEFEARFYGRKNKNLMQPGDQGNNYACMDKPKLDLLIQAHIDSGIDISKRAGQAKLEDLLWLSSDPLIFLFRPDYTDLLYSERIFMHRDFVYLHYEDHASDWLSESQDRFIREGSKIKTFNSGEKIIFDYFYEWIQYHLANKPEAAYFIETLARKYFFRNITEDSANTAAYKQYLQNLLSSPYPPVIGHAVYQLCKIWSAEGARYNRTGPLNADYRWRPVSSFDSSYRLYYKKTLELLSHFENELDSFSYIKTALLNMKEDILSHGLVIMNRDVQTPDSAFPVLLQYKNIDHVYTRVIRISPGETLLPNKTENISQFLNMPVFSERRQSLVPQDDHQWHNLFTKWDPLPPGRYIILYSDTIISNNAERIDFIDLSLTNMAVINNDQRVFILNRKTGLPESGANVLVRIKMEDKTVVPTRSILKTLSPKIVNNSGYVLIAEKGVHDILVYSGKDSIRSWLNEPENNIPDEYYNKEKYDDLSEYYEENIHLNIFTDRAIYRPGQTVFYKGIFTVRDPKTGELKILDLHKLRFPFFENLFYKAYMKFSNPKLVITISDPFNRTADSIRTVPNGFGSFSGSFLIPKEAATGEWNFDTEDYEMEDHNSGKFQVEEYKRPTFKLVITKPKTELKLGDSFHITIKTKSFAGAPMSHVRLRYHVSRYFMDAGRKDILTGESFSNEQGESNLVVYDRSINSTSYPEDKKNNVEYKVSVDALDETGESHEQELNITISNQPININIPLPEKVERNSIPPVYIFMNNAFSGPVKKPVDIRIYRLSQSEETNFNEQWPPADTWLVNREQWQKEFPDVRFVGTRKTEPVKALIYQISLSADVDKKIKLPAELLTSGFYQIEAICKSDGQIRGEADKKFSVYDLTENSLPGTDFEWLRENAAFSGDTLKLISGNNKKDYFSIYHMAYMMKGKNAFSTKYDYSTRMDKKGLNEFDYRIPSGITGYLTLTHVYIMNNQIYRSEHRIQILDKKNTDPDIIIEKYRTQIAPGEKETFTVSIKTKDPREVAELMTTMYDASLDELEPHRWEKPEYHINYQSGTVWNSTISEFENSKLYGTRHLVPSIPNSKNPLWWISTPDVLPDHFINPNDPYGNLDFDGSRQLQGQAYGIEVTNEFALNDVVVVGYGTTKRELTGAVMTVRTLGIKSLSSYVQPMIILDGVLFTGDINLIKPESITHGIILKGADAAALYGNRAADGVLILSTHGPIVLPPLPEVPMPPLVIRKNFSESAFFYPMIYAGKDGMYSFSFTLPESVTEWKWKLFAHTRKAGFAYLEKSLFSQLPLMVQPTMPRFLYQGDKIILKTRITSLDTTDQDGQLKCMIEDLVTGEDLSSGLLKESSQSFSLKRESNTAGSFVLSIPPGFLHPLRIRISAATNKFSDGEEHIIPVLSRKFLLTQTTSVKTEINHISLVRNPAFPADAEPFGLSLYINPKPQATLMNALTYLAFDPFGCSEQTLNKMLTFSMAVRIARVDSFLRQGISNIPNSENAGNKKYDEPEPDEQTMPWLQLRHASMLQQQKLKQLFDTTKSKQAFESQLTELMAMQNADGGLSWFKGGRTDDFISSYVLAGLGKMHQDDLLNPNYIKLNDGYPEFLSRLVTYVDKQLATAIRETDLVDFLYARSYWLKDYPVAPSVRSAADSVLKIYWDHINTYSIDKQATLITISLRFVGDGNSFHDRSLHQLESIRQLAISDSLNGVRWKAFSNSDDLDRQDEEAVARIAEAFETAGTSGDIIPGIVKWLLKTRNEHVWTTTKSTAAIIGLLQTPDLTGVTHQISAKADDSVLMVTDNLFGGRTAEFLDLSGKKFTSQISISTSSATVSCGIKYYYFSAIPPVDSPNAIVQVHKTLYRYNSTSATWDPINEKTTLQVSDKIKTVLTIKTARQLNYVFINERRAAAMEPREIESGYKYEDGLEYYQSVKDAGYLFFVDKIPSGIHTISYEIVVSASGNFTNGPASLQCMYQPSTNAYSNLSNIVVNP